MLEHVLIGKVHTLCRNMLFPEWCHIGLDARRILSGIPGIRLATEGGRIGALGGLRQGLMGDLIVARQPAGIVADLDACRKRHSRRLDRLEKSKHRERDDERQNRQENCNACGNRQR